MLALGNAGRVRSVMLYESASLAKDTSCAAGTQDEALHGATLCFARVRARERARKGLLLLLPPFELRPDTNADVVACNGEAMKAQKGRANS